MNCIIKNPVVEYKFSTYPSKFLGYQSKARDKGTVKVFIINIWNYVKEDYYNFVECLIFITILERICLERAFQKIRLKNRCEPYEDFNCKMEFIAYYFLYDIKKEKNNE